MKDRYKKKSSTHASVRSTVTSPICGAGILPAAVLISIAFFSAGCSRPLTPQAKETLKQTELDYERGQDHKVIEEMDKFLVQNGSAQGACQGWYLRGMAKFRLKDISGAQEDLTHASEQSQKDPDTLGHAQAALGEIAINTGKTELAENYLVQALKHLPAGKTPSDKTLFLLGCAYQKMGKWPDADLQFQKIDYQFPNTPLAKQAEKRVNARSWTINVGEFTERTPANNLKKSLNKKRVDTFIEPRMQSGKLVFLVQSGRYQTRSGADAEIPLIKKHCPKAKIALSRRGRN